MFQNPVSQDVDTVESTDNDVQEWDSFITMASSGTFDRKRLWVWDTRKITAQAVRPLEETSREDDQDDTFMSSESNQEVRQLPNFTRAAEILTAATKLVTTRIDITYNEVIRVNTQPVRIIPVKCPQLSHTKYLSLQLPIPHVLCSLFFGTYY